MIAYLITAGMIMLALAVLLFTCPSVRCLLGLHQWRIVGYNSVLNPCPLKQCELCGAGEQANIAGFIMTYTPEQMAEILAPLKPNEEPGVLKVINDILESSVRGKTTDTLIYDDYQLFDDVLIIHRECDCLDFQARFGVTIDSQDLREWDARICIYCEKPFPTFTSYEELAEFKATRAQAASVLDDK